MMSCYRLDRMNQGEEVEDQVFTSRVACRPLERTNQGRQVQGSKYT